MTPDDADQGFLSHLIELRSRLMRAMIAVVVAFLALLPFQRRIFDELSHPMIAALPQGAKLLATGVTAPFLIPLKTTAFAGFLLALPFVLYQAWAFIAPGLYRHEKRLALPVLVSSVGMFFVGMTYCYFAVFPVVFPVLVGSAPDNVTVAPDIELYLSFAMRLFLAFGVAFETPIVVMMLVRFGIASVAKLRQIRPYAIVGAFVIAAVLTPPDVTSQFLLAVPLWLLFELGVLLGNLVGRSPAPDEDAQAAK